MVAKKFAQAARGVGIEIEPQYLNDLTLDSLAAATHFLVITATYGDGEVPYDAEVFWESLSSQDAARLDHLTFAVLGLGAASIRTSATPARSATAGWRNSARGGWLTGWTATSSSRNRPRPGPPR